MGSPLPNTAARTVRPAHHTKAPETPLVLIHGFRGTKQGLQLIGKELSTIGKENTTSYSLLAPDLPGFGRGAHLPQYTLDAYVEWLHGYMVGVQKKFPRKKITLLGHSFGSIICAAYASKYPKTIGKLILVNPIATPALEGQKKLLTNLAILYYKIGAKLPEKAAKPWLASPLIVRIMSIAMTKTKDPELRKFIHAQHDQYFSRFHSPSSVLGSFKTSVSHTVGEYAATIPVKTLLIAGSIDDITPLSNQFGLVKKFPDAKLKVIDNVGHLTHYETPHTVAEHVHTFVKSV
ncbi:alpha/beta hydrolase [Candidatus Saccharibacteria bacterium TM7i]|nr:alpha/beta hydrolase [Candidatus Saccharibacteria bacterium TM7i]